MYKFLISTLIAFCGTFSLYAQAYQTNSYGVKYRYLKENLKNRKAKVGEVIFFSISVRNGLDSVLGSSFNSKTNWQDRYSQQEKRFSPLEIIAQSHEKDSIEVLISVDSLQKYDAALPDNFRVGKYLKYYVKISRILSNEEIQKEGNKLETKRHAEELKEIGTYLHKEKLQAQVLPSGLHIVHLSKGKGLKPTKGQKIKVHYTGKLLLSGQKFDSSLDRNEPIEFVLGNAQVIRGWDEGLGELQKGGKALLLIPSALGYGHAGAGKDIPPNAVLLFEVQLIDIK